jgi:hypothetical protein
MVSGGKNTHLDDRKIRVKICTIKNPGDSPGLPEIETRSVNFVKRPVEEENSISESDIFGLQQWCVPVCAKWLVSGGGVDLDGITCPLGFGH